MPHWMAGDMAMQDLFDCEVTCMLPVKDLAQARAFYEQGLGLQPQGLRADGNFTYRVQRTTLALFPKPEGTKAAHTALSFRVGCIEPAVAALTARGVHFADYDFPGLKTVEHVCVLGSENAAWFEDTEGNILCLHEDLAGRRRRLFRPQLAASGRSLRSDSVPCQLEMRASARQRGQCRTMASSWASADRAALRWACGSTRSRSPPKPAAATRRASGRASPR